MSQNRKENEYINLAEVLNAIIRHAAVVLLAGLICGIAGFLYSAFVVTPLYNASAMMIVNSGERNDYVTQDQLNSATTLVETYAVIITSDTVMDDVIENLGMKESYSSSVRNISVSSVNETQIMKITVTATNPEVALDVCEEITTVCPDVIVKTVKAGSVELVSKASTTYRQVSPNVKRNTVTAFSLGIILAAFVIALLTIMDNKVKGENDLRQADIALLGVIPFYELEER